MPPTPPPTLPPTPPPTTTTMAPITYPTVPITYQPITPTPTPYYDQDPCQQCMGACMNECAAAGQPQQQCEEACARNWARLASEIDGLILYSTHKIRAASVKQLAWKHVNNRVERTVNNNVMYNANQFAELRLLSKFACPHANHLVLYRASKDSQQYDQSVINVLLANSYNYNPEKYVVSEGDVAQAYTGENHSEEDFACW
ncbi:unnamed protein product [Cylicocyclus nassatus]|uniref:4Fe-4S ferredoxin-type domain-containing protein n=1 Tax=Cylicocyclus nassatus TaxID=53992 RepID=A0AA36H7N2_CYLNA|nr:unnamed protein product [Cylicocyclus nassatus]